MATDFSTSRLSLYTRQCCLPKGEKAKSRSVFTQRRKMIACGSWQSIGELDGSIADISANYMASTLSFLDELVALDSYLLPTPCLFLDYIPPIRRIVQADDTLEAADRAAAASGDERTNRRTGRPMRLTAVLPGRAEFLRYLNLPARALEDARSGSLV